MIPPCGRTSGSNHCPNILKKLLKFIRSVAIGVSVGLLGVYFYLTQPIFSSNEPLDIEVDTKRLEGVVRKLSEDFHPRNFRNTGNLNATADYIQAHFEQAGGRVEIQEFSVSGRSYKNVRAFFGDVSDSRMIIGAHYDSHDDTPGADDNASGVAGLVELAYLFQKHTLRRGIELVAYSLEEPPFFDSKYMGSYVHAKSIADESITVEAMIALEMIGYFDEAFGSQNYPTRLFDIIYPNTGNFIAVVGRMDQRNIISKVKAGMKGTSDLDVHSIAAPESVPGIDFSDHRNYWQFGYNAVMVTDTAFYRNHAYHTTEDTWDRLNYDKMANVVRAVYNLTNKDFE